VIKAAIFDLGSTLIAFRGDWDATLGESADALTDSLLSSGVSLDREVFVAAFREATERFQHQRQIDHLELTTAFILRQVLRAQGVADPPEDVLRRGLRQMYAVSEARWQRVPEADEVLERLRREGLRLGLLSNAGDAENVERLIDQGELRSFFEPIIVSAAVGFRKPDQRAFAPVLQAWRLHPSEIVMVGDTLGEDILGAQGCGLRQIWVRAFADPEGVTAFSGLVRPEVTVDHLIEVPDAIRRMNGQLR
jgi:putative hydrolase of the HAD superfamily